jgi:ABC-2 type transport system permease protein
MSNEDAPEPVEPETNKTDTKRLGAMSPRRYALFMAATLALIFLASNTLVNTWLRGARLDVTEDHLYSLSDGTKQIVGGLAEPIDLTLYYSAEASAKYPQLRAYSARVRELLQSIAARSHGQVRLREVNPVRFTESEDGAAAAGVTSVAFEQNGEPVYFGIAGANAVDENVAIPFIAPSREPYLEYEITRLISELETPRHVNVAMITSLPLDPYAAANPQTAQSQPLFFTELMRAANVEMMPRGFTQIPAEADELVIVQPWALSEAELYAIDQFIMAKGRAFIAADPAALSWLQTQSQFAPSPVEPSANLERLLPAWGVSISKDVVLDRDLALEVETADADGRTVSAPQPMYISVPAAQMSREDLITAGLQRAIYFGAAGGITWSPMDGVLVSPLARTSKSTMRLPAEQALLGATPQSLALSFKPSGTVETLAARVSGTLHSAFGPAMPASLTGVWTQKHLARSVKPAEIVLVSDVDFLNDAFYVGGPDRTAQVDNGAFAVNAIDLIAGSDALVSLRSRAPSLRSLEMVDAMRKRTQDSFMQTEDKLKRDLAAAVARLAALESKGRGSGVFSGDLGAELTPEERVESEKFRAQAVRARADLRALERDYRSDIEKLEGRLMLINVWAAPMLVAASGLFLFWRRARRNARREGKAETRRAA